MTDTTPDTPLREAASRYLLRQCERLERSLAAARGGANPDALHDIRVAIRRVLSAMSLLRPCFVRGAYRQWHSVLSDLSHAIAETRDGDVQVSLLGELSADSPDEDRDLVEVWAHDIITRREESARAMLALMDQWEVDGVTEALCAVFKDIAIPHEQLHRLAGELTDELLSDSDKGIEHVETS